MRECRGLPSVAGPVMLFLANQSMAARRSAVVHALLRADARS
jgi:hypothetical protein